MFSFSEENISPNINLRGLIISCGNVLDVPFEIGVPIYPILFLFFILANQKFPLAPPHPELVTVF